MRPHISAVAQELGDRLTNQIVPQLAGFDAASASLMSEMLWMISEEWDRSASRLFEENAAIREILLHAAKLFDDEQLRIRAKGQDTDLRISRLEHSNEVLRNLLIDVHAKTELIESREARDLEDKIWRELRASVKRRQLSSANF